MGSVGRGALPVHERLCLAFNCNWIERKATCCGSEEPGDKEHLLLGLTEITLVAFLLHAGCVFRTQPDNWWDSSIGLPQIRCPGRSAGQRKEPPQWLMESYPLLCDHPHLTGYEICSEIKSWQKDSALQKVAIMEMLLSEGVPGVGHAEHFLSHWQAEELTETLCAMRLHAATDKFFVDYAAIRQWAKNDFRPVTVELVIGQIHSTVFVYAPNPYGTA